MHYACPGTCGGSSDEPKVCEAEVCTHAGEDLLACDCIDGLHEAVLAKDDSEDEE